MLRQSNPTPCAADPETPGLFIHRFDHGQRACRCGALVVERPDAKRTGRCHPNRSDGQSWGYGG